MNIKKISLIIVVIAILLGLGFALVNVKKERSEVVSRNNDISNQVVENKVKVVASNFASYDF